MALNKFLKDTLRVISSKDLNVKKNYKLVRKMFDLSHPHYLKPFYRIWDKHIECDNHNIPIRIFNPSDKSDIKYILVFFHGGGWVTGNINSYDKVCSNLSNRTGQLVISVDYRLAPEFPFPAAVNDCYEATKEIYNDINEFDLEKKDIVLIGDSAGGNLAAVVSLLGRDKKEFNVKKQILLYPATYNDHSSSSKFKSVHENGTDYILTSKRIQDYMELYVTKSEDYNSPYFAPLLADDLSNQPETLIITAQFDPLRDEGEAYGQKLIEFGNKVEIHRIENAIHGYFTLPTRLGIVKETYDIINNFLRGNEN